tara:strand:- start:239 stop:409 length:171 start_codon:yes stop_codon:yes gene_type:complete
MMNDMSACEGVDVFAVGGTNPSVTGRLHDKLYVVKGDALYVVNDLSFVADTETFFV